jgi:hypothetical protein
MDSRRRDTGGALECSRRLIFFAMHLSRGHEHLIAAANVLPPCGRAPARRRPQNFAPRRTAESIDRHERLHVPPRFTSCRPGCGERTVRHSRPAGRQPPIIAAIIASGARQASRKQTSLPAAARRGRRLGPFTVFGRSSSSCAAAGELCLWHGSGPNRSATHGGGPFPRLIHADLSEASKENERHQAAAAAAAPTRAGSACQLKHSVPYTHSYSYWAGAPVHPAHRRGGRKRPGGFLCGAGHKRWSLPLGLAAQKACPFGGRPRSPPPTSEMICINS